MNFSQSLFDECKSIGIELSELALNRFEKYYNMLIEYNERMNLTAITEEKEVIVKHFCDSLYLLTKYDIKTGAKVIDVGTGAGFPGIPLLIARPDLKLTLLDGLNKRLVFLSDVLQELGLTAEIVHSRAEDGAKDKKYREKFDVATSRAVARLNVLSEYCLPYVKKDGVFLAMKGPAATDELCEAENALRVLGGKVECVEKYVLSDESERSIIIVKKMAHTHPAYPRHNSKIKKQPL
ncbi:MAG: 16S rRNA (guanine(527)-N(7))-methyltransferase RsmG [Ruminococcaceae bacterium]|nr:16S rRNA (guanine(527)-N(7))-methyltransferase RsmG [Oscillospiraceae bacterium]